MRWGLVPSWWSKPLKEMRMATFNARAETVAEKPMFRDAFKKRRCLIPASGYYEWQDTSSGKQPYYFTRRDGQAMTIAGLWSNWKDKATGDDLKSCTMVITEPNKFVADVHDRMPIILEAKDFEQWERGEISEIVFFETTISCSPSNPRTRAPVTAKSVISPPYFSERRCSTPHDVFGNCRLGDLKPQH
jgi:putative SOS response-associated peptidase YedK